MPYGNQWNRALANVGGSIADIILQNREEKKRQQNVDKFWNMTEGVRDLMPFKDRSELEAFSSLPAEYQDLYSEALATKEEQRQQKRQRINQKGENLTQNRALRTMLGGDVPAPHPSAQAPTKAGALSRMDKDTYGVLKRFQDQTKTEAEIENVNGNIYEKKYEVNDLLGERNLKDVNKIEDAQTYTNETVQIIQDNEGNEYVADVKEKIKNGEVIGRDISHRVPVKQTKDNAGVPYTEYTKEFNKLITDRKRNIEELNAKYQTAKKGIPVFERGERLKDFDKFLDELPERIDPTKFSEKLANEGISNEPFFEFINTYKAQGEKIPKSEIESIINQSDKLKNATSYLSDRLDEQRQETFELTLKAAPKKIQQIFEKNGWDSVYDMPPNKDNPEELEKLKELYNKWITEGIEDENDQDDMALQALRDLIFAKTMLDPEQLWGKPNAER